MNERRGYMELTLADPVIDQHVMSCSFHCGEHQHSLHIAVDLEIILEKSIATNSNSLA